MGSNPSILGGDLGLRHPLKEFIMIDNTNMLISTLRQHQFGFITVITTTTEMVQMECEGHNDYCDSDAHSYWEDVSMQTIVATGLLRQYTVRDGDILLTVLPWDKETKSFLDKRQLKFDGPWAFFLSNASTLARDRVGTDRTKVRIEMRPWNPDLL